LIDQRLDEIEQRLARLCIARGDSRLDEHLLFPIARALKVVSDGAIDGDADFAQRAIRTQTQIDAVTLSFASESGKQLGILVGDLLIKFLVADRFWAIGFAGARVEKHQVDVGAVIQLQAAQLTERNHRKAAGASIGKPRLAVPRGQTVADAAVRYVKNRVGKIRKLLGDFGQHGHAQDVAQHDADQRAAPEAGEVERRGYALTRGGAGGRTAERLLQLLPIIVPACRADRGCLAATLPTMPRDS